MTTLAGAGSTEGDAPDEIGRLDHEELDDEVVLSWWQHPVNVVALAIATLLIGAMAGFMVGDSTGDGADDDVSVGFLQDMRLHHEQAVSMGLIYLARPDTEPGLRTVARTIVMGQSIDIGRMIQLLRDGGQAEAALVDGEVMAWMGMPTTADAMPGMATSEQLDELAAAAGDEADELFVELMTVHHEGGIHMAEYAAEHAGSGEVRDMASSMASAQRADITEMEGRLD